MSLTNGPCRCGRDVPYAFHDLGCLACGARCCPACAIALEAASYCAPCAGSLLETTTIRSSTAFDFP